MRHVLKLAAYRRLLASYALNELSWATGSLALAVFVYRRTGSALGTMTFFLCSQFLPALAAPLLAARLDQLAPRVVLPVLYALEGLAFLGLALIVSRFSLAPVLILTTIDGIIALTARALARAVTVSVTAPAGLLREGNAVTNAVFSVCFMAGPALGGVIVASGGTRDALLTGAGLFTAIALTLASARTLPDGVPQPVPRAGRLRAALDYAASRAPIRMLLLLQGSAMIFFAISIPVAVVYAEHSLHAGPGGYGALLTAWGAGATAGSLMYARWRRLPSRVLIALGAGALGVGFVAMSVSPSLGVALAGALVGGAGNGIEAIAAGTALQERVDPAQMTLTLTLNESLSQALPGVGIIAGGAIAAAAGARTALAVAGAGALAITLLVWILMAPGRPAAAGVDDAGGKPPEGPAREAVPGPLALRDPTPSR